MAASVARTPYSDLSCIDARFQERDRAPPIGDLAPGIDVVSNGSIARAEILVVVHEGNKTRLGEGAGEALEAMFLHSRVSMCH
jgi:hypothetical protein